MARDGRRSATAVVRDWAAGLREHWFAGLTAGGLALVLLLVVLNALRRNLGELLFEQTPFLPWLRNVTEAFATGLITMLLVTLAVVATYNRTSSYRRLRYPALILAVFVASAAGTAIMALVESRGSWEFFANPAWAGSLGMWILAIWPRYLTLGLLIAGVFVAFRLREESETATQRVEVDRARFAMQMDEARLVVLRAQIEPHFLFNTLAIVRRLYQTEPAKAESMLGNLMRYLSVALPQMRAADSTLGREASLTESYLAIQQIRMGTRLAFEVDIPAALRDAQVPPMMILTLAENSIKHGLNPLPEGGAVRISARAEGEHIRLEVADTGQGFTTSSGGGTGLANTRARLAAMYGQAAQLVLSMNRPRGVTAAITLPRGVTAAPPP